MSVAVTLNNAFYFVQQAAGLADIFNEISRFPEKPEPTGPAQKPNALYCLWLLETSKRYFPRGVKYAPEMGCHAASHGRSAHARRFRKSAASPLKPAFCSAIIQVDAQMAKLVDAPASGAGGGNTVEVRVFFWAPKIDEACDASHRPFSFVFSLLPSLFNLICGCAQ